MGSTCPPLDPPPRLDDIGAHWCEWRGACASELGQDREHGRLASLQGSRCLDMMSVIQAGSSPSASWDVHGRGGPSGDLFERLRDLGDDVLRQRNVAELVAELLTVGTTRGLKLSDQES
jgi:hypothetical protein